jgi:hypothetical protein
VLVGAVGEEGTVGAAGDEGLVGAAGEEGAGGVAGEDVVVELVDDEVPADGLELPVAPIEGAAAMKCAGPRTSERSCQVESKPVECGSDLDATLVGVDVE